MKNKTYTGFNRILKSAALQTLFDRTENGSIKEFIDDWKWIFGYSKKYKWAITLYTVVGILSSTFGLGASVLPRIMADDRITAEELGNLGKGGLCLNCEQCTYPNCGFGKGW